MTRQLKTRFSIALAAVSFCAAGSALAGGSTTASMTPAADTPMAASPYTSEQLRTWYHAGPKTRAEVRAEWRAARDAGTLIRAGEIAEPPQVLAARDKMNAEQHDAIVAEYSAEHDRMLAQQEEAARQMALNAGAAQNPSLDAMPEPSAQDLTTAQTPGEPGAGSSAFGNEDAAIDTTKP